MHNIKRDNIQTFFCILVLDGVFVGFEISDRACCHVLGLHGGMVPCLQHTKICQDRSKYVFWDWFHVTETTNLIIAKRILDGEVNDISPINVRALSQI
ncbi:putative triacylglycerol lipase [Helianthus anomalus]